MYITNYLRNIMNEYNTMLYVDINAFLFSMQNLRLAPKGRNLKAFFLNLYGRSVLLVLFIFSPNAWTKIRRFETC